MNQSAQTINPLIFILKQIVKSSLWSIHNFFIHKQENKRFRQKSVFRGR